MTRKQYQARKMAMPRPSPEQKRANYEQHLLRELQRIGWKATQTSPTKLQLEKVGN